MTNKMHFTKHCTDNILNPFRGLITEQEILDKVSPNYGWRRHYLVKKLPRTVVINGNGQSKIGNMFLAIVEDDRIVNIILRCDTQNSTDYRDGRLNDRNTYRGQGYTSKGDSRTKRWQG